MTMTPFIAGLCRDCAHLWTNRCPIRVQGRVRPREPGEPNGHWERSDVDPDTDYCSKFELNTQGKTDAPASDDGESAASEADGINSVLPCSDPAGQ